MKSDILERVYMKKIFPGTILTAIMLLMLSGCSFVGSKDASMSVIYGVTALISLLLLIGYVIFIKKKELWFSLLFISVFVVNTGYFALSVSKTLEGALIANRISYLGSAFFPLSMLMTIVSLSRLKYKKWFPSLLLTITIGVFLIAASPGYLDIYYKSVELSTVNGVSVLIKEYGTWHSIYLYYLISYFALMIAITLHAVIRKKIKSGIQSAIILIAVFVNICVWLLEQLVSVNFEILSVSYIISELFLIGVYIMIQDVEKRLAASTQKTDDSANDSSCKVVSPTPEYIEKCRFLEKNISALTPTEKAIYDFYIEGKSTKEIMKELDITENTLKFHNKNIYSKLGVTSRKQILEYIKALETLSAE